MPDGSEESQEVSFPGAKPEYQRVIEQRQAQDVEAESDQIVAAREAYDALLSGIENTTAPITKGFLKVAREGDVKKRFVLLGQRPGNFMVGPWPDQLVLPGGQSTPEVERTSVSKSQLFFDKDSAGLPILRSYLLQIQENAHLPAALEIDLGFSGGNISSLAIREKAKHWRYIIGKIGGARKDDTIRSTSGEHGREDWRRWIGGSAISTFTSHFLPPDWAKNDQVVFDLNPENLGVTLSWEDGYVDHKVHSNKSRFGYDKDKGKFVRNLTPKQEADPHFGASKTAEIENNDMVDVLRSTLKLLPTG